MRVQLIAKFESRMTGISRYTTDLYEGLQALNVDAQLTFPEAAPLPRFVQQGLHYAGLDIRAFFANYPLRMKLERADVYHLTGQMLATLLLFQRFPGPVIVSVLDIIPYLVQHHPELNTFRHPADRVFYHLALAGLRRANALIAISEYTKRTLIDVLQLPSERIHVVYPAVDHLKFRSTVVTESFIAKYSLDRQYRYILFVGSEDPRKNLCTLVQAFAQVKQRKADVKLLKVGVPQFAHERKKLLALTAQLNLQQDVLFFDYVQEEDLPQFYNLADVFVMPSLYEGFGLPIVEAMACGIPVVYNGAGSLPEVVGESGIQVCSDDANAIADALLALLARRDKRLRLGAVGRERATSFTTARAAYQIHGIYTSLIETWNHG